MYQEVAEIAQNPLALVIAFDARRNFAVLLQLQADFVGDCLVLARTRARADDEIIGETGDSGEIQNSDVRGFFLPGRADCNPPPRFGRR